MPFWPKLIALAGFRHYLKSWFSLLIKLNCFSIPVLQVTSSLFHLVCPVTDASFSIPFTEFFSSSICLFLPYNFNLFGKELLCSLILFLSSLNDLSEFSEFFISQGAVFCAFEFGCWRIIFFLWCHISLIVYGVWRHASKSPSLVKVLCLLWIL